MNAIQQNDFFAQTLSSNIDFTINGNTLYQKKIIPKLIVQHSHSEYFFQKYKFLLTEIESDRGTILHDKVVTFYFEDKPSSDIEYRLLMNNEFELYDKPLLELQNKIYNIYDEHQIENWDGYGAEPIKYLNQSIQFAKALFDESRLLVESVDITPENDGCLCFEWFRTDSKFINISVKDNKLIYNYEIGDEKGCGETTFSGKQICIEKIKNII